MSATTAPSTTNARDALSIKTDQLTALLHALTYLRTNESEVGLTVESLQFLAHDMAQALPQAIESALDEAAADAVHRAALKSGGAA
ncbi:MAG: hypothetical protein RIQ60_1917 [Pseudomonadota bacterium]|jgi:transcription initiation factor TFIID subunit TAF12